MTVTVVGAGVAGLTSALELAKRGFDVEVIDRAPLAERLNASWYAGGMLAPWCEAESAEDEVINLGARAIDWWRSNTSGVVQNGTLVVARPRDTRELERYSRRTSNWQVVEGDQICELEPDLAGRFGHGLFFAQEAHLDPRAALGVLEQRLAQLRVDISVGEGPGSAGGAIVDACGFAARERLCDLRGVRGEMLILRSRDVHLSRPVRMLHPHYPIYIVPRANNLFMVGATMIESNHDGPVTARSMMELLGAATALHPAFGEAEIVETAAAIRPAFANNLPCVQRSGRVVHVNGLYRHGFLLAPAMAREVAEQIGHMQDKTDNESEHENESYRQRATA